MYACKALRRASSKDDWFWAVMVNCLWSGLPVSSTSGTAGGSPQRIRTRRLEETGSAVWDMVAHKFSSVRTNFREPRREAATSSRREDGPENGRTISYR